MNEPIRNAQGECLDYTFTVGADDRRDVVVVAHGVTSHKERPWLTALCEALEDLGIASLRFSFAGNGASEGRFEDATITKEVEDLGSVLDALDGWHIAYAGHSMGGAVGLLRVIHDDRIRAFASLAGMVHIREFMWRMFGHLVPDRDVMLDKSHCPLTQSFLDDATSYGSLLEQGKRVRVPWLIVHGTSDDIVPLRDSRDMSGATGGKPTVVELEGVDHRFTNAEGAMAGIVAPWLDENLRAGSG